MCLHALESAGNILPTFDWLPGVFDCWQFLQPLPLVELSQPLITYLERLTATQELITNELIIDPPPKDSN